MIREIFRYLALIPGYFYQLIFFTRKTYYEDKRVQGRRVKGGALVVSNHYHVYDYFVNIFVYFPWRKLYVVMKSDVYRNYAFCRWGLRCFGAIPADRDQMAMGFVDESIRRLRKGCLVQIFPEAHTAKTKEMLPFKTGYVLIAQRADVPIIPIITDGNYGLFRRTHIIIGKPIRLSDYCEHTSPSREEIEMLNEIVRNRCLELQKMLNDRIREKKRGKSKRG